MALVNFYNQAPVDRLVALALYNDELVVFNHSTSGAQGFADQVTALVDFAFNVHNENTIPKWEGPDYFVMVRSDFDYQAKRETLRAIAAKWVDAGCLDQVKHI